MSPVLSIDDMLDRYPGISRQVLAVARMNNDGPPYVKFGKTVLYRLEDVKAWERANTHLPDGFELPDPTPAPTSALPLDHEMVAELKELTKNVSQINTALECIQLILIQVTGEMGLSVMKHVVDKRKKTLDDLKLAEIAAGLDLDLDFLEKDLDFEEGDDGSENV